MLKIYAKNMLEICRINVKCAEYAQKQALKYVKKMQKKYGKNIQNMH